MKPSLLLLSLLFITLPALAHNIEVKNISELNAANKKAKPGDVIILKNGEWKDVIIRLDCHGTKERPVRFKAQSPGKVKITGRSQLKIGGSYIIVDGLYFTDGYAGNDAVISYRINKELVANNCRITNSAINDFNNPKRMDENYWVAFYGKNNRLDHCSFKDKKNMGVTLAVILDDERSRQNYHSIDNNYFGRRPPLASNTGETIRVGVSQHAQFNSNTIIKNNFFDECDGETEVVSIKSGSNRVEGNIFRESQGSVVLRHGDDNIVTGNYFIGNDKTATGGVRVINKGQVVTNNIFYKCRGKDFRAPLAIMNGIPNSPAHRYVQVTEARITDNYFYECAPVTFGEGSDDERTLAPDKVVFERNYFYNTRDSVIYKVYDDIKGFRFVNNNASQAIPQRLAKGFSKSAFTANTINIKGSQPVPRDPYLILQKKEKEYALTTGASWFPKKEKPSLTNPLTVHCSSAEEVYRALEKNEPVRIILTGSEYILSKPFHISKTVHITSNKKPVVFSTGNILSVFLLAGKGNLQINELQANGRNTGAKHFISSDSSGSSQHYNLVVQNSTLNGFNRNNGCENIFYAHKSMVADSIVFRNNAIINNSGFLIMAEEKDDKGYYNAEKIIISRNQFSSMDGTLVDLYRGGNDESTLGPNFIFMENLVSSCNTAGSAPLMSFYGTQVSRVENNFFTKSNTGKVLIRYADVVRASHALTGNRISESGKIEENNFVEARGNQLQ